MDLSPLLSVIVPVFNSEDYLDRAFASVLNQDFGDYELILINDGSTDNSSLICRNYAKKDIRVKFFDKKNGGLCSARNYGLAKATGQYVMFMDNDDEYVLGAFQTIAQAIKEYNTDIVRFNRKRIQIFDDGSEKTDIFGTKGITSSAPVVLEKKAIFSNYNCVRKSGCFAGIWNGAFKRSLFDNIRFDESVKAGGEDTLVNMQLYENCKDVVFLPDVLYVYYRRTRHSVSTTFQLNQIYALGKVATLERSLLSKNGLSDNEFFSYVYVYLASIVKMLNHKNCDLSLSEKKRIMDSLCQDYMGFRFSTPEVFSSNITLFKKLYTSLYTNRYYRMLFMITGLIMRIRGNA